MKIFDFDKFNLGTYAYGGCEPKTCVGDGKYLLIVKEPRPMKTNIPKSRIDQQADFYYNCISEYLGSHIFALCGIDTQETYLGYYTCKDGIKRLCVGCKDFTTEERFLDKNGATFARLCTMAQYKHDFNRIGDEDKTSISREDGDAYLDELENIWHKSKYLSKFERKIIIEYYDRFVVDALIGNPDRHNENWGFLTPASDKDEIQNIFRISPVYDCGASFLSQANANRIAEILEDEELLRERTTDFPKTQVSRCVKDGLKGIRYYSYFNSLENEHLNKAILRMCPVIEKALPEIYKVIDDMESSKVIEPIRAKFYKTFIDGRFKNIIQKPYLALKKIREGNGGDGLENSYETEIEDERNQKLTKKVEEDCME